jgi:hypothetical protein
MAKRNWKSIIGAKAREVFGSTNVTCNVATRQTAPEWIAAEGDTTYDMDKSDDLYDNCQDLRTFKKGWLGKDFSGTLDIWVYSYERFDRDGYHELEFNLYAKFEDGRLMEVTDS